MNRWVFILVVLTILGPMVGVGYAAPEPKQVTLESLIQREIEVTNEDGEKEVRLIEAGNAIPGDELIFTVTYTNQGGEKAENVVLVNPVPDHTEYIDGSAAGKATAITFSVDGGESYDLPGSLRVTGEDGKPRLALARDYTHLRWVRTSPLSPGQSGKVTFRVRLK